MGKNAFRIWAIILVLVIGFFANQIATHSPQASAQQAKKEDQTKSNSFEANLACQKAIENSAKYDLRWTDSWTHPKFTGVLEIGPGFKKIVKGDAAEAQNGFGGWVRVRYVCGYRYDTKNVVEVTLTPGHF